MQIIQRYVLRSFLPAFVLSLFAFSALYFIVDFFEKLDDILEKQVPAATAIGYFVYKTPLIVVQGIPLAALLAALITFGILKRNRELVALQAAGVGPLRYMTPIIVGAAFIAVAQFGLSETVARSLNQRAQEIWYEQIQHKKATWKQENVWFRGHNVIYQIRYYDRYQKILNRVTIFTLDNEFKLLERLDAKQLRWEDDKWVADEGIVLKFTGNVAEQEWFYKKVMDLDERPEDFSSMETIPEELGWFDLYEYTDRIRKEGYNALPYEVELHSRVAFPLTTLVLALLGMAVSLRQGLHGGIPAGVGISLLIAFAYLAIMQVGSSLSTAGILPPIVGVWSANVLFAAAGSYVWKTADF